IIEDGGVIETATKTIPILLQTVDLEIYPEGGDLVAGLKNRVYLSARTPAKKPADIAGVVVDSQGETVAEFRTEHEGRGRFELIPRNGDRYELKITEPAGIKTRYPLPEAKPTGVVLRATKDVYAPGEPIELQVTSTIKDFTGRLTLRQREKRVAEQDVASARQAVTFDQLPEEVHGVLIATLWDEKTKRPLAERLVFRQPQDAVNVSVTADRESYVPGGSAKLTVKTTDSDGEPISAVVGLTVTDDSVQEMIEKREQAPRLPVMVFLEPEVQELADAHVYLDAENPEAPRALDLLLGTQGWRRFAFIKTTEFLKQHGDDARRVLALRLPNAPGEGGLRFRAGAVPPPAAPPDALWKDEPQRGALPQAAEAPQEPPQQAQDNADRLAESIVAERPPADQKARTDDAAGKQVELQQAFQQGQQRQPARLIAAEEFGDLRKRIAPQFIIVREYAHQPRPDRKPGDRVDFTETLYWHAGLKTDAETGEATVSFALSDAVTSFRVMADAFTDSGAVGQGTTAIESVEPFYVEPKLPLVVTSGDEIRLPIGIVNATSEDLSTAAIEIEAKGLTIRELDPFAVAAEERIRRVATIEVGPFTGSTDVTLRAMAGSYTDRVTRPLRVEPLGFPIEIAHGGMLLPNEGREHTIVIPSQVVPGSLQARAVIYPTPLANLTEALERLIQEPCGCFEQTSSSTYPLVMAQQYFQSHTGVDPKLIERANEMLEKGHNRLMSFECKSGGFEWFGEDPGHEALTAYGLMEFTDMAQVRPVDSAMLARTRTWLLGRRDGQGGFKRERRALHTWLPDADVSNAYITWALLSAGETGLDKEIDTVHKAARESKNSYVVALAANVMVLAKRRDAAIELMDRLITLQTSNGDVQGATTSIVGSGGEALSIETTALATLAWITDREYADHADAGIRYLTGMCKAGRFGSTQSTILALKAIVAQDKALAHPKSPGAAQLLVDGRPVGEPVKFDRSTQEAIELPDIASLLKPGEHTVVVKMTDGSSMPYSVAVTLHSNRPASSEACKLRLGVSLSERVMDEGAVTEARVVCENTADETVPTPVAIIGVPGGLEVRHDQLKELVKSQRIAAYEVRGRDVILYWRALEAGQTVELPLSLVAAVPGRYTGPASRAYLYYT
ncbi:MAG: alpha-2-macroglobulin family protein, partial [Planctomycetaceae bacterium]